ncbi:MAG: multidrug efflux SMR transporter [Methanomassiliicoccaceae archaeon]|nr:multidrug efflux SMR transporter [Methanomassiliicoccaceae archaeon]
MNKGWTYILIGGLFEIVWAVSMKYSDGFASILWTITAIVFILLSMVMLSKAISTGMPLGTAYAVWVGIGAAGIFAYGIFFMDEPAGILRILFAMMIIAGIVGLQKTSTAR